MVVIWFLFGLEFGAYGFWVFSVLGLVWVLCVLICCLDLFGFWWVWFGFVVLGVFWGLFVLWVGIWFVIFGFALWCFVLCCVLCGGFG